MADDWRRQDVIRQMREAIGNNDKGGPMDAGWLVTLALESI